MTEPQSLSAWRARFRELDKCPWPGPRPLGPGDEESLIGRVPDRKAFRNAVKQERLILLHGPSGVGKSSLIQAGLVPDMRRAGMTVFSADQWGGVQSDDIAAFLAIKLGLPSSADDPFEALNAALDDRAVIVLDQFEELVRYSPATARRIYELILDFNRRFRFKVVVSFRSEYLHEINYLEQNAVNFSVRTIPLADVADDAALRIVTAPNPAAGAPEATTVAIDPLTAELIASAWRVARDQAKSSTWMDDPFNRVGLLHLQAMMYALYFIGGRSQVDDATVTSLLRTDRAEGEAPGSLDLDAFRSALQRSIETKLQHCAAASRPSADDLELLRAAEVETVEPIDDVVSDGTAWMLARTATHLSSAGYKLIRGSDELVRLAMGVDHDALLDGLRRGREQVPQAQLLAQVGALFEVVLGLAKVGESRDDAELAGAALLDCSRSDIAAAADVAIGALPDDVPSWSERLSRADDHSWQNDLADVTCGTMMGMSPADVLIEEFRRFAFALVWLESSALIRVTRPLGTTAMISLIHDGFGRALMRWADEVVDDSAGPLSAITAPRGASFIWSPGPAVQDVEREPAIDGRVLPNLRWRGGFVIADMRNVVFLNCDFRGTFFEGCRMTGVTFVNCLLDGAIFSNCIISGEQNPVPAGEPWDQRQPVFRIAVPADLVRSHASARGLPDGATTMFCDLPGAPAIPGDDIPGPPDTVELAAHLEAGGVTVYGGRISSLVIRGSHVDAGSGFSLRHTTGSGLEIVEYDGSPGRFEIFGSALRQITITARVDQPLPAKLDFQLADSMVAQLWAGPGLHGTIALRDSFLVHAGNGSPPSDGVVEGPNGLVVERTRSGLHGLLVAELGGRTEGGLDESSLSPIHNDELPDQMYRMNYRTNPAKTHFERPD